MAKSNRMLVGLICKECNQQNYVTIRSKINTQEPLALKKFCNKCKKQTDHKEKKKLD